ncbi:MAG: hypothetical protein ABSH19_08360 [Opitutales bacterium]
MPAPCPHLPPAPAILDWRELHRHGADRGPDFYLSALTYGQHLWQRGLAARALLAVDRALLADVPAPTPWPLPYRALRWLMTHADPVALVGNPRVHYQHLAGRLRGPRAHQQRVRAWAAWHLARLAHPTWPGDLLHPVAEPTPNEIATGLDLYGLPGETVVWRNATTNEA